jgi:prepilin-type N-terminal cleavage/methylation domain-containing protein
MTPAGRSSDRRLRAARVRGMTLVEMVAALTLGALLTAGLTGALRGLVRQRQSLERVTTAPGLRRFTELLTRDLERSRQARFEPGRLTLDGCAGRDEESGVKQLPAEIRYELRTIDGSSSLIRCERLRDSLHDRDDRTELVLANIGSFRLVPIRATGAEASDHWSGPSPEQARIIITATGAEKPILAETVYVH